MDHIIKWIKEFVSITRDALRRKSSSTVTAETESRGRSRYVKAMRTTIMSGGSQFLTAITSILSVALTVRYLGTERYGVWLIISTILAWLSLSDFGIGNAITNKLSETINQNKHDEEQWYVASAFWMLAIVGILIISFGIILGKVIPWTNLLNVKSTQAVLEIHLSITFAFIIFGLGFPLTITRNVYRGYQEGYYANVWDIAANIVSMLSIVIVTQFKGGLPILVAAVYGSRQLVFAASAIFIFYTHRPWIKPDPRQVRKGNFGSLLRLGLMFITLQLCSLLITQTDSIVIIRILGPSDVAIYSTIWKLFSYTAIFKTWFLSSLWPAYGEANTRQDYHWIQRTLKMSLTISILVTGIVSGIVAIFAQDIIRVWVGPDLVPSISLIIGMLLMQILWSWTEPFVVFLNGISRLKNMIFYSLGTAVINVILTIVFVRLWGIEGAILGTMAGYLILAAWLLPLDAKKALKVMQNTFNKTATIGDQELVR